MHIVAGGREMSGCDYMKKSFKISMHSKNDCKAFDKTCAGCLNNRTEACAECHGWNRYIKKEVL